VTPFDTLRAGDLLDQVGADVGRLAEDAAADPHEHGQQGRQRRSGTPTAIAQRHAGT
jgi:hypothetical protein